MHQTQGSFGHFSKVDEKFQKTLYYFIIIIIIYQNIFSPILNLPNVNFLITPTDPILDTAITKQELSNALKACKVNSAPGIDGISYELLFDKEFVLIFGPG